MRYKFRLVKDGSKVIYYRIGDLMVVRTLKYDDQGNCVSDEEKLVTDPKQLEFLYVLRNHIAFTNMKDRDGHLGATQGSLTER